MICTPVHAAVSQENYAQNLIDQASKNELSETRVWHLLLHYKKGLFGHIEGQEDGMAFYNAPDGKHNPEAELAATLKSFFKSPETLRTGEQHPQCDFPARYKWLKRELAFDPGKLPSQPCPRLQSWLNNLNPKSITLVFSSSYMNNPASMFGHTLLRIDTKRDDPSQKLLNYGVNYAATLDADTNALLYIFKGLFGFFKGEFSLFPYYIKVQTYSNMESRDLWEYELNFTDDQMDTLLRHLWELGGNYFDYYYFQENCSYHILSLLEIADPDLHLTDEFWFHVIPSDTVKAIMPYEQIVSKKIYRPSLLSQMNHKRRQFSEGQEAIFRQLVDEPKSIKNEAFQRLDSSEKALVLDAFLDYAQYRNMQSKKKGDKSIAINNRPHLLARSKLRYTRSDAIATEFSTRPELGHGSDRLKIGFGLHEGEAFEEFSIRPAYHDLLSKDTGFGKGSQILFLDITARYYNERDETKLERFDLIRIVSLTPYDPLFKKKSWHLGIGLDTIKDFDCDFCNSFKTSYGMGFSHKSDFFSPFTAYIFANLELELTRRLESDYRAGGGGTLGFFYDPWDDWRIQLLGKYIDFPLGHESSFATLSLNQRYALTRDFELRLEFTRIKKSDEGLFSLNFYF